MAQWTFRQFVTPWEEWPFRDWYNAQGPHVRTTFDIIRKDLEESDDWGEPEYKPFEDDLAPLGEMRFRADDENAKGKTVRKRRIRPIGFLRPEHKDFILFGGCEERPNGTYIPGDVTIKVLRLFRIWQEGRGELHDLD